MEIILFITQMFGFVVTVLGFIFLLFILGASAIHMARPDFSDVKISLFMMGSGILIFVTSGVTWRIVST